MAHNVPKIWSIHGSVFGSYCCFYDLNLPNLQRKSHTPTNKQTQPMAYGKKTIIFLASLLFGGGERRCFRNSALKTAVSKGPFLILGKLEAPRGSSWKTYAAYITKRWFKISHVFALFVLPTHIHNSINSDQTHLSFWLADMWAERSVLTILSCFLCSHCFLYGYIVLTTFM